QVGQRAINIETQHGTDHLHGQMFLFNRQHLLNAQNPFTTWMRETAPRSGSTVPSFTAEPYSPSDLELRWGVGAGGLFRPRHVFWFAALDGVERNYPAVSAVRHPDRFFAQPENDQMQLLSAQLGLSSVDPVAEGVRAYSKLLESLAELLGPAARSSQQLSAFERLDWRAGDRHRFMLEGTENLLNAPGGGSTRAWQTYGTHSFGSLNAKNVWLLGRWQAFVTPNLLAIAQGSIGREIQRTEPQRPSPFEQSLNIIRGGSCRRSWWILRTASQLETLHGLRRANTPTRASTVPGSNSTGSTEICSGAAASSCPTKEMQPASCAIKPAPTITRRSEILPRTRSLSSHLGSTVISILWTSTIATSEVVHGAIQPASCMGSVICPATPRR